MRVRRRWLALALCGTLVGCAPGNGLSLAKVRGKVTHRGQPLRGGDVLFLPIKGTLGPPATASIRDDGTYILSTERAGDGAPVGDHQVALTGFGPAPTGSTSAPRNAPASKQAISALLKESRPARGAAKGADRPPLVTPETLSNPATSGVTVKVGRGSNTINFEILADGTVAISQ